MNKKLVLVILGVLAVIGMGASVYFTTYEGGKDSPQALLQGIDGIELLSPRDNDSFAAGDIVSIRWQSIEPTTDTVGLSLRYEVPQGATAYVDGFVVESTGSEKSHRFYIIKVKNTGSYEWTIPGDIQPSDYILQIFYPGPDGIGDSVVIRIT